MQRKWLFAGSLLAALLAATLFWATRDRSQEAIRVTVVTPGSTTGGAPSPMSPVSPPGPALVEVEVARPHAIPMKIGDVPVAGPGIPPGTTMLSGDLDAVERELAALRSALDEWAAAPERALRVVQTWPHEEMNRFLWFTPREVRVVLHAQLAPTTPAGR